MKKIMDRQMLAVVVWSGLLFLPFLGGVHLFDWDEINFAESAREMLLTKEFFRVQINFQPFWEKPPLFFWLQACCMEFLGVNEMASRLPNAITGIISMCMVFYLGRKYFSTRMAGFWVLFTTASLTPHLYFKSGIIDPVFNLFIFASVVQLFYILRSEGGKRLRHYLLMGLFCGLGVLTKGPVALLVLGLCGGVYWITHRLKPFFKFTELFLFAVLVASITSVWFLNEWIKNGPGVLVDFFRYQVELFTQPVATHGQPWFYHPVVLLFGAFPASFFALKNLFSRQKDEDTANRIFSQLMQILFWVVLILFSITTTKIVHYSSLCYLPITFFAARSVDVYLQEQKSRKVLFNILLMLTGLLLSLALVVLTFAEQLKSVLVPLIKDDFVVASLQVAAGWKGYEFVFALLFLFGITGYGWFVFKREFYKAVGVLLLLWSVALPLYLKFVVPNIEAYTQGPAIRFYEQKQGEACYVETLGFKSYAQYFYTRKQPLNPNSANKNWLISGEIDKPSYFVVKVNDTAECRKEMYPIERIGEEGGFVFYQRMPKR